MRSSRGRGLCCLSILLALSLCSCQQGAADGDLTAVANAIHPAEVSAVRWIAGRTAGDLDGGRSRCACSEPSAIARPLGDDSECDVVCLGGRGFLVARMSASFTNGDGADLLVYEWGAEQGGTNDRLSVAVSENGHEWIVVAESVENDPDRPYASIDLGDVHGHFLFVRIAAAADTGLGYATGPEILAVEALYSSIDPGF